MNKPTPIVQKSWKYCKILRDDGLSYGDHVEQLTLLLFLTMAGEEGKRAVQQTAAIAEETWIAAELERRSGVVEELEVVVPAKLQRATPLRQSIHQKPFSPSVERNWGRSPVYVPPGMLHLAPER